MIRYPSEKGIVDKIAGYILSNFLETLTGSYNMI